MKRIGLISLVMSTLFFLPVHGQADSARSLSDTNKLTLDSTPASSATEHVPLTPAGTVDHSADSPENKATPGRDTSNAQSGYAVPWAIGWCLSGMLIGALGFWFLNKKSAGRGHNEHKSHTPPANNDDGGFVAHRKLEQEHAKLEALNKELIVANEQLKRDKAELEQLLKTAGKESGTSTMSLSKEIVFYMPQPNMNGRFQEASKRTDAADALYAFRVARDNPATATFEFIAKDAYLNAAIGNEPSWISTACERTNQPSGSTTRVKTESPGQASLKNGEWEITRKAKITYL